MDDFLKKQIIKRLKREPNELEWCIFSAMWCEHCGYMHSKKELKKLNYKGAYLPEENAGGIKIGDWGVFFKVESHNHPCAIEPYQGAATGIGGIIRDVLALNARPIALLNSLKFAAPNDAHTQHIIKGVTEGISDYGNSTGIANVGGEVIFDKCYKNSPLVNVMALGIAKISDVKLSKAKEDLSIVLLGSNTGLDGVGGASFASKELQTDSQKDKIHVQIGDPFIKKQLIEATLEILKSDGVIACQDCGAAGLLSSTTEIAYKGKCSIELDLDKLHLAKKDISAAQILLSESQERMVFALKDEALAEAFEIAKKYDLNVSKIGKTFIGNDYRIIKDGELAACLPLDVICEPYLYDMDSLNEAQYIKDCREKVLDKSLGIEEAVEKMVCAPEFASKKYFYEQWDYAVGNRTFLPPDNSGAAALWLKEAEGFIGVCMDSKPRFSYLDPKNGAINTFFESWRNLVSSGFEPLGFTNCLNFGNPEKKDVKYQFTKSIEGLAEISKKLDVPVVSGNVSFYNESENACVYPTVTIGMVGFSKNEQNLIESKFQNGDDIYLLGKVIDLNSNLGGSLYQSVLYDFLGGRVDEADINLEVNLKNALFELKQKKLLNGALDVSKGGLLGTLLCALFNSDLGFTGSLMEPEFYTDSEMLKLLFGEIEGRYIFSTKMPEKAINYLDSKGVPYLYLGRCFGDKIKFDGYEFNTKKLKNMYENALKEALKD